MCGIAAILGVLQPERVRSSMIAMLHAQAHRGPDDQGSLVTCPGSYVLGLGNRRLAIQDTSLLGHQPMRNDDTGDLLVYNGEIYNAPDLRHFLESSGYGFRSHSDTEVLLRAYQHWGTKCLSHLRGMFAFALWDSRRERLIVARDHIGIKPLYYTSGEGFFACASEVTALIQGGFAKWDVGSRALAGYLAYGSVQEPLTICEGVYSLPRGSWREIDTSGQILANERYWNFPTIDSSYRNGQAQSLVEEGRAILKTAVHRHLLSDVPLGVFLSAGLDSTAILGLSLQQSRSPIHAFTVTFPDHPADSEGKLAELTAARLGAHFHDCPISDATALRWIEQAFQHMDQPSLDGFNTYIVARAVREQGIVVALSGLGGDEVFGGYNLFRRVPQTYSVMSFIGQLPPGVRRRAADLATLLAADVFRQKAIDIVTSDVGLIGTYFNHRRLISNRGLTLLGLGFRGLGLSEDYQVPELQHKDSYVAADHVSSVGRLDASFYMQNTLLRDSDVFGMANSLEIRVPFLDRDVMEWAFRLPGEVLLPQNAPSKYLLRKMCAELYSSSQRRHRKRGFTLPIAAWMQGPLSEFVADSLNYLSNSGLLEKRGIQHLWASFKDDPDSPAWSRVWALVSLSNWKLRRTTGC
ncbi:MAG: asparagine synthase (glutamine-hydrolyzing) [Acidobacteriia bacterium]|nr:asparagine synthase (glutamine-hydrolyzing) [Terriglobia bacterium]